MASLDFGANDCLQCRHVTRPVERSTLYLDAFRRCVDAFSKFSSNGRPKFLHIGLRHIAQVMPSRSISGNGVGTNFVRKGPAKLVLQARSLHVNSQYHPASQPEFAPKYGTKVEPAIKKTV